MNYLDDEKTRELLALAGLKTYQIIRLADIGYFTAPASKGHHLAERGGLARHSVNVTQRLVELTKSLGVKWPREESPYLVGMLHDLVKCECYRDVRAAQPDEPPKYEYVQPLFPGHGSCSVAIATTLEIQLMVDEMVAIMYHMGPWGVGKEYTDKEFDAIMKSCCAPQIIATHTADWWACRVDEGEVRE